VEAYDVKEQLEGLADSVDRFKPDQTVNRAVGQQANILLDEMAAALPDNPVVAGTPRFPLGTSVIANGARAADVSAVLRLVAAQVPRRGPSIA
jgi:hypothetical protein